MLMSRGHFRHLPVSGDTGLAGMLDITDVCHALIDPTSPSAAPPATPGRGNPSGTARGQFSVQNTATCAPRTAADQRERPHHHAEENRWSGGLANVVFTALTWPRDDGADSAPPGDTPRCRDTGI
jgi:hypothetical protein